MENTQKKTRTAKTIFFITIIIHDLRRELHVPGFIHLETFHSATKIIQRNAFVQALLPFGMVKLLMRNQGNKTLSINQSRVFPLKHPIHYVSEQYW